jgi:hypothetical protein
MPAPLPRLTATEIGEFIRHRSCERRFKLEFDGRAEAKKLPFAERLFNALDPVLQEEGKRREEEWEQSLQREGALDVIPATARLGGDATWSDFLMGVSSLAPNTLGYGREVTIQGNYGNFNVNGRVDFCLLRWEAGRPKLRLIECKASRRDRTYQRIQVALYGTIVRQLLANSVLQIGGIPLTPDDIECVVARIDESTNESQALLTLEPFDLTQEEADLRRLLASDGALARIAATNLDDLDYQLDAKCDGCVFNVHCYPESARQRRIQLIGVEPSIVRALASAGIETIDHLADIDLTGSAAQVIRALPGFNQSLTALQRQAHARRSTLPGGRANPDTYEVEALPNFPQSQLPEHEIGGQRLVRIYLSVHYDYVENRIGAMSGHVTASDGRLHTGFVDQGGTWGVRSEIVEQREVGTDANNRKMYSESAVRGTDIVRYKASPWTGRYAEDTGAEREILQGFFQDLVDAIAETAGADRAPIHFYVWSRSEMARLVEACSRVGSGLLAHLRELLGCREPLEQLIYSCLEDEIQNRYALGWTGRGLAVATSLTWYGRRYLWRRNVNGGPVDLDHAFTQDIFDFKTELWLDSSNQWTDRDALGADGHKFEIRSRFHDTLTAPYWRALWGTLPDPMGLPATKQKVANAIRRYNEAGERGRFKAYLRARSHALRWIDEGVRSKNADIAKPLLEIRNLIQFSLDINNTAGAAIDFLRIDHHVALTDWLARHLVPPAYRAPAGRTLPIADVQALGGSVLSARIDLSGYDISQQTLQNQCTIGEGSFVRLTPARLDPTDGQTLSQLLRLGSTCVVDSLDWQTGDVRLTVIPRAGATLYVMQSFAHSQTGSVCDRATLDESPSDFVKGRVEARLQSLGAHHACSWLNPLDPQVPTQQSLSPGLLAQLEVVAGRVRLPNGRLLAPEQTRTAVDGLSTRIQLLQGPPGTGKTTTTAVALLLRVLARRSAGDIVMVAANTHAAVNNLLDAIARLAANFSLEAGLVGLSMPSLRLAKIESSDSNAQPQVPMEIVPADIGVRAFQQLGQGAVGIIGGTTGSLLKIADKLDKSAAYRRRAGGFQVSTLVVDEASMMVFPHFLALSTLVDVQGEMMLTGDHRQLAPIMAHDWEREDRPPVVLYQPYASAYDAVRNIAKTGSLPPTAVSATALQHTFRLPAVIRDLISRLYSLDQITLTGRPPAAVCTVHPAASTWERVWEAGGGLFLIVHSEKRSTHSNPVEAEIIGNILDAAPGLAPDSTAIVTPHRAQRNMLSQRLGSYTGPTGPVGVIDTVEKLQGGERPNIIVSATESDPASIAARVEFILDLNRSNVAFSRSEERLIVICSDALLDHIPAEIEHYQSALLWKSLREYCSDQIGIETVSGHTVKVFTPPLASVVAAVNAENG